MLNIYLKIMKSDIDTHTCASFKPNVSPLNPNVNAVSHIVFFLDQISLRCDEGVEIGREERVKGREEIKGIL